jgi:hypothetical protein
LKDLLHGPLPEADYPVVELVIEAAIGKPPLIDSAEGWAVGLLPKENGHALHGQVMSITQQDIIPQETGVQQPVGTRLELEVNQPGLGAIDPVHAVGSAGDGGEIGVEDRDRTVRHQGGEGQPGAGV